MAVLVCIGCVGAGFHTPDYVAYMKHPDPAVSGSSSTPDQEKIQTLLDKETYYFKTLWRIARINNPNILAAISRVGAAAGDAWQSELYPNPRLELEAEGIPEDNLGTDQSKNKVSLIHPIILSSHRADAISANRSNVKAQRQLLKNTRRNIRGDLYIAYTNLLFQREAKKLYEELLEVSTRTLKISRNRFEARAAPESEVIKSQVEVHELRQGKQRVKHQFTATVDRLKSLLGAGKLGTDKIQGSMEPDSLGTDLNQLRTKVRKQHPVLIAARSQIDVARHRLNQVKAERYPDPDLRLSYGRNEDLDENFVEAGVGFPIPIYDRNQGRIFAARQRLNLAERQFEEQKNDLLSKLSSAYAELESALSEYRMFQDKIVPAAERAFSQSKSGYTAGKTEFLNLLDAQRTVTRAKLSRLHALRDVHLAIGELQKITGPIQLN